MNVLVDKHSCPGFVQFCYVVVVKVFKYSNVGQKFLRKALEIKPNDAWALNSLAAGHHKKGQTREAIVYFDRAIEANPDFANPYYGKALTLAEDGQSQAASDTLTQLFASAKMQVRAHNRFSTAREICN